MLLLLLLLELLLLLQLLLLYQHTASTSGANIAITAVTATTIASIILLTTSTATVPIRHYTYTVRLFTASLLMQLHQLPYYCFFYLCCAESTVNTAATASSIISTASTFTAATFTITASALVLQMLLLVLLVQLQLLLLPNEKHVQLQTAETLVLLSDQIFSGGGGMWGLRASVLLKCWLQPCRLSDKWCRALCHVCC